MTLTSKQTRWAHPTHLTTQGWKWPSPWIAPPSTEVTESWSVGHRDDPGMERRQVADGADPRDRRDRAAHPACKPGALTRMYVERGVSPWIDQLSRADLGNGSLSRMITAGVRGIAAGQTELTQAFEASEDYDEQLSWLMATGCTAEEVYWELVATDALAACALLRPVYEISQGADGFVSLQGAPPHSHSTRATMATICQHHRRINRPNLLVAIPASDSGVQALRATVSAGCNIVATSIFSPARYAAVVEAYQAGLETFVARGGDPTTVHSFASFSLSPVDAEVDRRIELLAGRGALEMRGLAATAQAILACRLFQERFSTERWARLAKQGARPQRLVWAAGTPLEKNGSKRYVNDLSVPNTVHVLSASTLANLNLTCLEAPSPAIDVRGAAEVVSDLAALRIDLDDVAAMLERQGSAVAQDSLSDALDRLSTGSGQR